jgi:hypothetical protein
MVITCPNHELAASFSGTKAAAELSRKQQLELDITDALVSDEYDVAESL